MTVHQICDTYVGDLAALDPMNATYLGIAGYDESMTDFSPDGYRARAENGARALRAIADAEPADASEVLAKAVFMERVGLEGEIHAAGLDLASFNTVASPIQEIRRVFDFMPTGTTDDWAVIGSRLAKVPEALVNLRASLEHTLSAGHTPAARQAYRVAEQCDAWAGLPSGQSYFDELISGAKVDGTLSTALAGGARAATEAYAEFGRYLREGYGPRAPKRDAVGADAYQLWSRYFLGTNLDLTEAYEWGWHEFARIEAEMATVAERIKSSATMAEVAAALDADPRYRVRGHEEFRTWAQELGEKALAELRDVHFDIPEELMRLECRVAPPGGPSGQFYYAAPSDDFSRPGAMWWGPPAEGEEFPNWQNVTTVYHEGAPGHHLQVGTAVYRRDKLNRFQRLMAFVSGHGEGWALYTEGLMRELGYLDDDAHLLGMLNSHLRRAARVILDIGIHLELPIPAGTGFHEGERWTPELGVGFLTSRTLSDKTRGWDDVHRFLGLPGHATSYKLGERAWLAAIADARRRHGREFDLKAFHTYALNMGSIPLDILTERLAAF